MGKGEWKEHAEELYYLLENNFKSGKSIESFLQVSELTNKEFNKIKKASKKIRELLESSTDLQIGFWESQLSKAAMKKSSMDVRSIQTMLDRLDKKKQVNEVIQPAIHVIDVYKGPKAKRRKNKKHAKA